MTSFSNTIEASDIFVAGARSTGEFHIGNYLGAVKNFVDLSASIDHPMFFFIADLHSLTTHTNAIELQQSKLITLSTYLGCGVDPERSVLYFQSDIFYTHELYLYLNMFANIGELERTATFKEKIQKHKDNVNAGLLTYPVLMAADILLHKGTKVPVGKDQAQHIEMTRTFSNRFNHVYQTDYFKEAFAYTYGDKLISIPSLKGQGKMSKSDDPDSALLLLDSDEHIERKIKRAVTDAGPKEMNSELSPETSNLFQIMRLFSSPEIVEQYLAAYADCSIRYGDMKKQIAEDAKAYIGPIRESIQSYLSNPEKVRDIAMHGAEKANRSAKKTLEEIRDIMGLTYKNLKA